MDIGKKIKEARARADLTQEQAAEALGVSRQTVSNWENSKSYPDIVSVVKMSDLYSISLDCLLKDKEEDNTMSNYLDYLEESTNVVKSKRNLSKLLQIIAYLIIWAMGLIWFWSGLVGPTDAMAYGLLIFYFVLPVTTLVISILIGKDSGWGKAKWLMTLFFGFMFMLAEYATFNLANIISNHGVRHWNTPEFSMMIAGIVISFIGMGIGTLIQWAVKRKRQK